MRKFIIAAAVAAVASLGFVGRAEAQAFYPGTSGTPATRGTTDISGGQVERAREAAEEVAAPISS